MEWRDIKHLTEQKAHHIVNNYFVKHGFVCQYIDTKNSHQVRNHQILWFQANYRKNTLFQMKHFVNSDLPFFEITEKISNLLTPTADEGIIS